ncbi:hypothetical protein E2C01_006114 [Portunus trituberculatus]|uniref:Uncharacterized protein n=1 Tax=Portunus trituberculatus TaxID=210409 RepID=A0A5B7CUE7_PORTR|nr:hypothetical protein [Portunus trituberculatus]
MPVPSVEGRVPLLSDSLRSISSEFKALKKLYLHCGSKMLVTDATEFIQYWYFHTQHYIPGHESQDGIKKGGDLKAISSVLLRSPSSAYTVGWKVDVCQH